MGLRRHPAVTFCASQLNLKLEVKKIKDRNEFVSILADDVLILSEIDDWLLGIGPIRNRD